MNWFRKMFSSKPESEEAELSRLHDLHVDLTARRARLAKDGEKHTAISAASDWPTTGWDTPSSSADARIAASPEPVEDRDPIDWTDRDQFAPRSLRSFVNPDEADYYRSSSPHRSNHP